MGIADQCRDLLQSTSPHRAAVGVRDRPWSRRAAGRRLPGRRRSPWGRRSGVGRRRAGATHADGVDRRLELGGPALGHQTSSRRCPAPGGQVPAPVVHAAQLIGMRLAAENVRETACVEPDGQLVLEPAQRHLAAADAAIEPLMRSTTSGSSSGRSSIARKSRARPAAPRAAEPRGPRDPGRPGVAVANLDHPPRRWHRRRRAAAPTAGRRCRRDTCPQSVATRAVAAGCSVP